MKMWTMLSIVAVILIITSATIFLLPKNDEINQLYNQELQSGDSFVNEDDTNVKEINSGNEIMNEENLSGDYHINLTNEQSIIEETKTNNILNNSAINNTTESLVSKENENINSLLEVLSNTSSNNTINQESVVKQEITNIEVINQNVAEDVNIPETIETVINNVVIPDDAVGMISIPKISVNRPILEGHSLEVLKNGLGHVEETAYWQGNIGILGHNSGNVGFFKDLTKLVVGDTINYTTEYGTRNYKVSEIVQIDDTDWSYLSNTKNNRITLITCVKGVPEKRLCVQAIEVE